MNLSAANQWLDSFGISGVLGLAAACVYLLGIINAGHAIMRVRLSQSAIAWSVFLLAMPWLAIPLYWVFGSRRFEGYTAHMRTVRQRYERGRGDIATLLFPFTRPHTEPLRTLNVAAVQLGAFPFTTGNRVDLLVDGPAAYSAMLASIENASEYILFQTYILNDDSTGRQFLNALSCARQRGVRVFLLFDEVGSTSLTRSYLRAAARAGIITSGFKTTQRGNRFQLNFRNHRKIIVVDGRVGYLGGLNIGDEHLGHIASLKGWRDTHACIKGPALTTLQHSFLSDWFWAMDFVPEVRWDFETHEGDQDSDEVLILPTGPADKVETCSLFVGSLIDIAKKRIWIATPYFVPDEPTLSALKIAALRGVDVRIIVPIVSDHVVMRLCTLSHYEDLRHLGVRVFEYESCFMHQKVILIDDLLAGIGTVNLDNRSFHLNFEVMAYVSSKRFVDEVAQMLEVDLKNSREADLDIYNNSRFPIQVAMKVTRLFSAVL
jgi:cardiolipin synthase